MSDTVRATKKVELVIDPAQGARDAWGVHAHKERALAVQLERTPVADTAERERINAEIAEHKEHQATLLAKVREGIYRVTVRALSRGEYRNLIKNHGPRPGDELDKEHGYNVDTFAAALLRKATISAETMDDEKQPLEVDKWLDDETGVDNAAFEDWFRAALSLNTPGGAGFPPLRAS